MSILPVSNESVQKIDKIADKQQLFSLEESVSGEFGKYYLFSEKPQDGEDNTAKSIDISTPILNGISISNSYEFPQQHNSPPSYENLSHITELSLENNIDSDPDSETEIEYYKRQLKFVDELLVKTQLKNISQKVEIEYYKRQLNLQ